MDKIEITNKREFKYSKEAYLKIKSDLKVLALEQKMLKPQRKEDQNLKVVRTVDQATAIFKAKSNKSTIYFLHILYDEVRGKEVELEKLVNKYYKLKVLYNQYLKSSLMIEFKV